MIILTFENMFNLGMQIWGAKSVEAPPDFSFDNL